MPQDKLTRIVQPDPGFVDAFSAQYNDDLRLTVRSIKPQPHRIIRQIGDTLDPGYTPGRVISIAVQAGAPIADVEAPFHGALALVRSLYPADLSLSVREASLEEQRPDGAFDLWQAALRDDADEFTLRRGIALAVEQRHAIDKCIDVMRSRLAERRSLRLLSRARMRPQKVAR